MSYDPENTPNFRQLLVDLYKFTTLIDMAEGNSLQFGFAVPKSYQDGNTIWTRNQKSTLFIRFLLALPTEKTNQDYLKPHIDYLNSKYVKTSKIIAKYLITSYHKGDDILFDYYEAWAEII